MSTTIDKYCFLNCRYFPPFFPYKHRIVYAKTEEVKDVNEILHPAVKAVLKFLSVDKGLSIHHDADLPARVGLGSSSAFMVGLLNAVYALQGENPSKEKLAKEATYLEREVLKEAVGSQDQVAAAFGGFNKIVFLPDDSFEVTPMSIPSGRIKELEKHMMLVFAGFDRYAPEIAKEQIESTPQKKAELTLMQEMVDEAIEILADEKRSILDFGKLLNESWKLKKSLTDKISTPEIDYIYQIALKAGALGGKLLGAGGGGFMLLFLPPEKRESVKEELKHLLEVPFHFEKGGSQIIYSNHEI